MQLDLHTVSRDKLFDATAKYIDGKVTVLAGSKVNLGFGDAFKPSELVRNLLQDRTVVDETGKVLHDVTFDSLSTAATFVAGRISNGMITWKTPDGQYVRKTLKK